MNKTTAVRDVLESGWDKVFEFFGHDEKNTFILGKSTCGRIGVACLLYIFPVTSPCLCS